MTTIPAKPVMLLGVASVMLGGEGTAGSIGKKTRVNSRVTNRVGHRLRLVFGGHRQVSSVPKCLATRYLVATTGTYV